jgi:hypothetical protein
MRAGTVAEVAKSGRGKVTWEWARYFYEESIYEEVDGLSYLGAFNDGECVALSERCLGQLRCDDCAIPLSDPAVKFDVLRLARENHLSLDLATL